MKTKHFFVVAAVAVVSVIGLCSFTYQNNSNMNTTLKGHNHITIQGAHCRGTVGCGCPGFSPITNGQVWQQSYCRHCGHAKSVHK